MFDNIIYFLGQGKGRIDGAASVLVGKCDLVDA